MIELVESIAAKQGLFPLQVVLPASADLFDVVEHLDRDGVDFHLDNEAVRGVSCCELLQASCTFRR